jgi:prepilin-type N-terminal cleavage/methylation domain-containing protein
MRSFAPERRFASFQACPAFAGFTLMEALVVIAVIGVLAIIAIAAFGNILRRQKLNTEAREVLAAMSVARVKATSANFNYTFTFDRISNSYQISGVEPLGPDRLSNAAFDANGNGVQDTDLVYKNPRQLQYTTFTTTSVPDPLPSGVSPGSVPANTVSVVFNSYGVVISGDNERCVVLKLGSDSQAVCAETGGILRLYRGEGSSWVPIF